MSKFKVGDTVLIIGPKNRRDIWSGPGFYEEDMGHLVGKVGAIENISRAGNVYVCNWYWAPEWVELVTEHSNPDGMAPRSCNQGDEAMSKHGTDERGWPLVPCDPAAIPEGYEAVRVGYPRAGEIAADVPDGDVIRFTENWNADAYLIVRPIKPPIEFPLSIVPHGWWVARDSNGEVWCYEERPKVISLKWGWTNEAVEKLPPWIAAQLPSEWHELPWDKSAMQQTRGGDT